MQAWNVLIIACVYLNGWSTTACVIHSSDSMVHSVSIRAIQILARMVDSVICITSALKFSVSASLRFSHLPARILQAWHALKGFTHQPSLMTVAGVCVTLWGWGMMCVMGGMESARVR